ncbi:hypothetical protein [Tengunoibacter tsumagoiensis]|uniref:hypothetical protein n=1 Tax=Tengunoibacter tsumagoiensis TaxID=2014871 RepID=UPI000F848E4C|nr:hypothetical protein [Tengunoibacter tsumagoiensis]
MRFANSTLLTKEDFSISNRVLYCALDNHIRRTRIAVPGGQAPGEITATSSTVLRHDNAAGLSWWIESLSPDI